MLSGEENKDRHARANRVKKPSNLSSLRTRQKKWPDYHRPKLHHRHFPFRHGQKRPKHIKKLAIFQLSVLSEAFRHLKTAHFHDFALEGKNPFKSSDLKRVVLLPARTRCTYYRYPNVVCVCVVCHLKTFLTHCSDGCDITFLTQNIFNSCFMEVVTSMTLTHALQSARFARAMKTFHTDNAR